MRFSLLTTGHAAKGLLIMLMMNTMGIPSGTDGAKSQAEPAKFQEISAMGRSFTLGNLYDIRKEIEITSSLWNSKTIEDKKMVISKPFRDFRIKSVTSFEDKADFMEVDAQVKMSIMGGLVKISGSAHYLKSRKSSDQRASVTAFWKSTDRIEQLTQEIISSPEYLEPLENTGATHVIAGITYGANAYFNFEKTVKDSEDKEDLKGRVEIEVSKIFSGSAELEFNEEQSSFFEDVNVRFYGDYSNIVPPTTVKEAGSLVKQISESKDSVPMKITLAPLHHFKSDVTNLLMELNENAVRSAGNLRSYLGSVIDELDEALEDISVDYFPRLKTNLVYVQRKFQEIQTNFQTDLRQILPKIRNNEVPETKLLKIMNKIKNGVYHKSHFEKWLKTQTSYAQSLGKLLRKHTNENAMFLPSEMSLFNFQSDNYGRGSYYILEGSLRGADETYYIDGLKKNDTALIENAKEDNTTWVHQYRMPLLDILHEFSQLDKLEEYIPSDYVNIYMGPAIEIPRKAIKIEMPGTENVLKIKTFYKGREYEIQRVKNITFVDGELQYYYPTPFLPPALAYEIRWKTGSKITEYRLNSMTINDLDEGQNSLNVRVILEGGVRGPWNAMDYIYTKLTDEEALNVTTTPGLTPFQKIQELWKQKDDVAQKLDQLLNRTSQRTCVYQDWTSAKGSLVSWDKTTLQEGPGSWDNNEFIIPFDGIFSITWSLWAANTKGDNAVYIYLRVDGVKQDDSEHYTFFAGSYGYNRDQGGRTMLVDLKQNQRVGLLCEDCSARVYRIQFCIHSV